MKTLVSTLLFVCVVGLSQAQISAAKKVFPSTVAAGAGFGARVAASPKWVAVAAPGENGGAGAVYVYSTSSGSLIRKLVAPASEAAANDAFGSALSISGSLLAVGAPFGPGTTSVDEGCVYIFDLANGKQKARLNAPVASAGATFGRAVEIAGTRVLIGAPVVNEAWLLDALTGVQVRHYLPGDPSVGKEFGSAVAFSGERAVIGAPGDAGGIGAVYTFDDGSDTQLSKFTVATGVIGDRFGAAVALAGGKIVAGAPGRNGNQGLVFVKDVRNGFAYANIAAGDAAAGDQVGGAIAVEGSKVLLGVPNHAGGRGAVYLADLEDNAFEQKFQAPDSSLGFGFGSAVAVSGDVLWAGSSNDNSLAATGGSAYRFAGLAVALPGEPLAVTGNPATGIANGNHSAFTSFQAFETSEHLLLGTLSGSGASAGKNVGLWSSVTAPLEPLRREVQQKATDLDAGPDLIQAATLTAPVIDTGKLQFFSKVMGTGITTVNDMALFVTDGTTLEKLIQEGSAVPAHPPTIDIITQAVRKAGGSGAAITLRKGTAGVTVDDDSGLWYRLAGGTDRLVQENAATTTTNVNLGQVVPRAAIGGSFAAFTSALRGSAVTTADDQALGYIDFITTDLNLILRKGASLAGGTVKSILAESISNSVMAKVTLAGVASSANEALLFFPRRFNAPEVIVAKGAQVPGLPTGVKYRGITRFWHSSSDALALVTLTGTGVNSSNDVALLRWRYDLGGNVFVAAAEIIMREGDLATGCGGAKIGVIQQVDASSSGNGYAVIVSLTGTGTSSVNNQALYFGAPEFASDLPERQPDAGLFLQLRKGAHIEVGSTKPVTITSLKLTPAVDASGAGSRGFGDTSCSAGIALQVQLSDRRWVALKYRPL